MDYSILTIGSHSALQILKGARDEGFNTIAIVKKGTERPYRSFGVADQIITLDDWRDFEDKLDEIDSGNPILIPHGSLISYLGIERIKNLKGLYFGDKEILKWEADRNLEMEWFKSAGIRTPITFETPDEVDRPVIVKFFGAGGGDGYIFAKNHDDLEKKLQDIPTSARYLIQEYLIGTPFYIHYFYSPLNQELEVMSFDKRYETSVDALGRIPAATQIELDIKPNYLVIGNQPLVIRESYLSKVFELGDKMVESGKNISSKGLIGPFCLETVITEKGEIVPFEISARIVAGTNPFINGSPYTWLRYNEPMSTGRRIAREIKNAIADNKLDEITT